MGVLSSLQLRAQLKEKLDAIKRQTIAVVIALILLIAAIVFGFIALYHVLSDIWGLSAAASAGIMAGSLLVLALIVLAVLPLFGPKKPKPKPQAMFDAGNESLLLAEKSVSKAMTDVGPLTLLALAFAAGLLASRRR